LADDLKIELDCLNKGCPWVGSRCPVGRTPPGSFRKLCDVDSEGGSYQRSEPVVTRPHTPREL